LATATSRIVPEHHLDIPVELRILDKEDRCYHIADFFTKLAHWLLGGHRDPFDPGMLNLQDDLRDLKQNCRLGDLLHYGLGSVLEVKSSNNHNDTNMGLRGEQIAGQLQLLAKEEELKGYSHHYLIFSWKACTYAYNPERGYKDPQRTGHQKRKRQNAKRQVAKPTYRFAEDKLTAFDALRLRKALGPLTRDLFIVDTRILDAARKMMGTRRSFRNDPTFTRNYVCINRTFLRDACKDIRGALDELELSHLAPVFAPPGARGIRSFRITTEMPVEIAGHRGLSSISDLTVHPITTLAFRRRLKRFLNGTVAGIAPLAKSPAA
jgi:hypothetical protein